MDQEFQQAVDHVYAVLATYGLNVLGALLIIVVGLFVAGWAKRATRNALTRTRRVDLTLAGFLSTIVQYAVIAFVLIAALERFGVEATSLIALLGAAGLAVGLALQGTLSNVAAGVMILLFRPFKVGDYVEAGGMGGTVKDVGLFTCELATADNVKVIMPNGQIWGQAVINYSANATRRIDLVVRIGYEDDIDQAMATIGHVFAEESRGLADPAPMTAVNELGESAINIVARLWVNNADYWSVRWDLTKKLKERLEAEGITIPYPHRTVYTVPAPQPEAAE